MQQTEHDIDQAIAVPRIEGFVVSAWQSGGHIFVYLSKRLGVVNTMGVNLVVSRPPVFACFITQTMFLVHI